MARKPKSKSSAFGSASWGISRDVVDATVFGDTNRSYLIYGQGGFSTGTVTTSDSQGNSTAPQITSKPITVNPGTSAWITGSFTSTGSWGSAWFGEAPDEPTNTPTGFMQAIRKELGIEARPSGILMHGLTWYELTKHAGREDLEANQIKVVDNQNGYLFGVPVRTSWEMPEWEWVFARAAKDTTVSYANWKAQAEPYGRTTSYDHKSNSIKAKGR